MNQIPLYTLPLPEYHASPEPDHGAIGKKVDDFLKEHFLGQYVAVRCLSSGDHPGKSVDDLIDIIQTEGWDRYDPQREGDRYENNEGKHIDFFAFDYTIAQESEIFSMFTWPFYHWEIEKSGRPLRIDLILLYKPSKLEQVYFTYASREDEGDRSDGWIFKNPKNKRGALVGIIQLTE
ncbi:MAG: hypothetical protein COV60_03255 [Candidatus Magasanikbacteria bacterium CG11_big_fil_rev_8_21_14_0_20_43_7]|uniref:Uncharacterized protein n=1 Tax=Candidatus Magasanikbacteria bacterium CG11_big_fil_rev_8_21_14_0_20_43_7 TaxID=1974654 RepID=A0A2H0N1Y7_9BACT|nr:MAG: hypothetical protein COV60_03255 [Candidatus Magasanikbacteria bacterium CG11_big_fil_rev_8_21_14_0_20_43_7]